MQAHPILTNAERTSCVRTVVAIALFAVFGAGCDSNPDAGKAGSKPAPLSKTPPQSGGSGDACATTIRFREVTADRGVDFVYRNDEEQARFAIIESMGGGVGLLDYDRDGWLDLCASGGGAYDGSNRLTGRSTGLFR
ncbi:MAG TPA: hypothetical protein VM165_22340, partial [Planctomycetaceae bacterium]|nr:hypothetical protein [Planctomycetaceae bacterium]